MRRESALQTLGRPTQEKSNFKNAMVKGEKMSNISGSLKEKSRHQTKDFALESRLSNSNLIQPGQGMVKRGGNDALQGRES